MGFQVPNEADATYGVQARLFSSHLEDLVAGIAGTGVRSGCACSVTTGMTVAVAGGTLSNDVTVSSGSVTLDAADGTHPRVDIVRVRLSDGALSKVTGTPGTDPVEPAAGAGYVKLWAWYVPAGVSALTTPMGTDRRVAPTDLTEVYRGLPSTSFIYNSSGPQEGTRYNSWPALMAALGDTKFGGPRNILFEQNETLPPGTFDLTDVTLLGNGFGTLSGANITVYLSDATTITNPILSVGAGLLVVSLSSSPLISGHAFSAVNLYDAAAIGTFGAPLILQNGGTAVLGAYGNSTYFVGSTFGANPIVTVTDSVHSAVSINQNAANSYWDNGIISTDAFTNVATVFYNDPGPAQDPAASTIVGSGGTYTRVLRAAAPYQAYTPAVTTDWTGADPTTIAQALDRIAAAIGPI